MTEHNKFIHTWETIFSIIYQIVSFKAQTVQVLAGGIKRQQVVLSMRYSIVVAWNYFKALFAEKLKNLIRFKISENINSPLPYL